jgi:hypothetical protein
MIVYTHGKQVGRKSDLFPKLCRINLAALDDEALGKNYSRFVL